VGVTEGVTELDNDILNSIGSGIPGELVNPSVVGSTDITEAVNSSRLTLNDNELKQIGYRLVELKIYRAQVSALKDALAKDEKADAKAEELRVKEVALYKREIELRDREIRLLARAMEFYESAYDTTRKKGISFGCVVKKIFTLGISKCK